MRVVIGAVLIAVMRRVFTLMTAAIFVTQHLFASVVLAGLLPLPWLPRVRRRQTRRSQPGLGHPAAMAGRSPPVSRWAASEMSSAASRLAAACQPCRPGGACHEQSPDRSRAR